MKNRGYFKGYYFKHQKGNETVSLIPGISEDGAFIQVITNERSINLSFPIAYFGKNIVVNNSIFSRKGIKLNEDSVNGKIFYKNLTPIKSDIMGPFKWFPMECRHGIVSMHHALAGGINIDGKYYDFDGGVGYIESDSGRSFPEEYLWLQCNDFHEKCSVMVAVAHIPFMGFNFTGCICAIVYKNREYRLATYNGVKIKHINKNNISLSQGKYSFEINIIGANNTSALASPVNGKMKGIIHESNNSKAHFLLRDGSKTVFELYSENVSFEYNYNR